MTRKILINGRREEEVRVAIVENQTLEDFEIETKNSGLLRNNIYRGIVSNIAPSLNAAFVDFGDVKNGFLAFNDVVESAYNKPVKDAQRISDVLVVGQPLIVQVIKDATGLKGAQVTTNISLAGRYLVLRPKDAKSGVSRKVDEDARADLTQKARSLDLPDGYGCIVRTNAMDQSRAILLRDAKVLIQLWHKIEAEYARSTGPALLYNDQDIVVQAMRDYFDSTINEVLIDNKSCYERALAYIHATVDGGSDRIKYYDDRTPLFTRYNIERQINQIYARTVSLPSGGFIVIDPTEALTAIDVNSARATKRDSQDLTAYHTNLEAAAEIGRQLRMRDIGGLIVIDFIDMKSSKYQRDVERAMRTAMSRDKARNKCERISANGLLEINRQRLSQALSMRTHLECPTCGGRGFIPTIEALGLNLIREIEARAVQGSIAGAIISLSPENAQTVQNARRHDIAQLEEDYHLHIEICAVREMSRGEESIEWLTKEEVEALHPGHTPNTNTCAVDVSSLVEVTEAYNAQSPMMDDSYRPNDFEEFSSDEARKRRATRRAKRAQLHADAAADASLSVTPDTAPVPVADTSVSQKRVGLAVLTSFIRSTAPHLDERSHEPRRRMNIRGHRRPHREDGGIKMDSCLFALDMIRAICTIDGIRGNNAEGEMTRKELIANAETVVNWLSRALTSAEETMSSRCAALIAQTASRHARARLEVLFSGTEPASSDALGIALCTERDIVLHKYDDSSSRKALRAIDAAIAKRMAEVFGDKQQTAEAAPESKESAPKEAPAKEPASKEAPAKEHAPKEAPVSSASSDESIKAPATFDTSALQPQADEALSRTRRSRHTRRNHIGEESADVAFEATPKMTTKAVETPDHAQKAVSEAAPRVRETGDAAPASDEAETGGRRRRHASRRAIGDTPLIRDNNEVVCAEVEVPSMTVLKVEEDETDIAQAITQELPAVDEADESYSQRMRRERRRQRESRNVPEITDISPTSQAIIDEVASEATPGRRERRERRRERTVRPAATAISSKDAFLQASSGIDDDAIANEIDNLFDDLMVNPAAELERDTLHAEDRDAAGSFSRVRRTRRGSINGSSVAEAPAPVSTESVAPASQPEAEVTPEADEAAAPTRRQRRTRTRDRRERVAAAETDATPTEAAPAVQEAEAAPVAAEEVKQEAPSRRETRRVRKTNARRAAAPIAEADAQEAPALQAEAPTVVEVPSVEAEELPAEETPRKRQRRVRRTSTRSALSDDAAPNDVASDAESAPAEVISPEPEAIPQDSDASSERRMRRTRRSRIDDASEN